MRIGNNYPIVKAMTRAEYLRREAEGQAPKVERKDSRITEVMFRAQKIS